MPAVCSNNARRRLVSLVPKRCGDARQVPDRIDGDLDDGDGAVGVNKLAVGHQALGRSRYLNLRQVEPRARNRNARTNIGAFGYFVTEILRYQMPPRVKRDDALRVAPLLERPDGCGWIGIGQIRAADRVECAGRDTASAR